MAHSKLEQLELDIGDTRLLPAKKNCHKSFECPICQEYMTAPIMQCVTGHSICAPCKEKAKNCPICKKAFSTARNFALESVVENITFPCENSHLGCKISVYLNNKDDHGENCPYRTYECLPCRQNDCQWEGKKDELVEHAIKEHKISAWMKEENSVERKNFSLENYAVKYQIIKAFGEIFWFQSCILSEKIAYYVSVHYIGPKKSSSKYYYSLRFNSLCKSKHKIAFVTQTHPASADIEDLIDEEVACFCLKNDIAQYFTDENGTLKYKLDIIKDA